MNEEKMMNCPNCVTPLTLSERQGVELDYCPQCRGVWLDRGELDKIIERSSVRRDDDDDDDYRYERGDRPTQYQPQGKKKRSGFLGDLFDF